MKLEKLPTEALAMLQAPIVVNDCNKSNIDQNDFDDDSEICVVIVCSILNVREHRVGRGKKRRGGQFHPSCKNNFSVLSVFLCRIIGVHLILIMRN